MNRAVEIRTYRLKPGTRETLQRLMEERCLPLLHAWGMDVVHLGPCALEPDGFVLIRAYDDAGHLQRSQDAFYGSDAWRQGPREAVLACIDQYLSAVIPMGEGAIEALRTVRREA